MASKNTTKPKRHKKAYHKDVEVSKQNNMFLIYTAVVLYNAGVLFLITEVIKLC